VTPGCAFRVGCGAHRPASALPRWRAEADPPA
jgi:hypothetical protein